MPRRPCLTAEYARRANQWTQVCQVPRVGGKVAVASPNLCVRLSIRYRHSETTASTARSRVRNRSASGSQLLRAVSGSQLAHHRNAPQASSNFGYDGGRFQVGLAEDVAGGSSDSQFSPAGARGEYGRGLPLVPCRACPWRRVLRSVRVSGGTGHDSPGRRLNRRDRRADGNAGPAAGDGRDKRAAASPSEGCTDRRRGHWRPGGGVCCGFWGRLGDARVIESGSSCGRLRHR
jgi:hypothetical protein